MDLLNIVLTYGPTAPALLFAWMWLSGKIVHPREVKAADERRARAEAQVDRDHEAINRLAGQVEQLLAEQRLMRQALERRTVQHARRE